MNIKLYSHKGQTLNSINVFVIMRSNDKNVFEHCSIGTPYHCVYVITERTIIEVHV